jgi:hypothetical protein
MKENIKTFAEKVNLFNQRLEFKDTLPEGIQIMNPFKGNDQILKISKEFYEKYYNDKRMRHLILGINPGKNGAGVTGIPFTDTKRMNDKCGIEIQGLMTYEPSSVFVYDVIEAYGGVEEFYSDFYINSVCPLGFTKISENNRIVNYNYYDSSDLSNAVYDFIVQSINQQLEFGIKRDVCFCLGTGNNTDFLNILNSTHKFFDEIISLKHPRYIMQYKTKFKQVYINKYIKQLKKNNGQ